MIQCVAEVTKLIVHLIKELLEWVITIMRILEEFAKQITHKLLYVYMATAV